MDRILDCPPGFWVSLAVLTLVAARGWKCRREAWGIPVIAVCGTAAVWYHGDVLYNDYNAYSAAFGYETMDAAWWQVVAFAVSFGGLAPFVSRKVNPITPRSQSTVVTLFDSPAMYERLQGRLEPLLYVIGGVWGLLSTVALVRSDFDWQGLFLPWLGHKADPWGRGRIGGGIDFLLSFVGYLNTFCLAGFGVVAALAKSRRLQSLACGLMAFSWPFIFLDRTRNTMLVILLPGLLCCVFLRLRRRPLTQLSVMVGAFMVVNIWFAFVMAKRSTTSIAAAFSSSTTLETSARHEGLNMFGELCWINKLLGDGAYRPNWGYRYYTEIVNPIPRTFWRTKPTIALDYAVARGQGTRQTSDGVHATVATGMIGQGVVNFGPWGGPPAAALLVSLWVAALARLDLNEMRIGRTALYALGLALTFNLGRDVTLLVAYPLVFGYAIVRVSEMGTGRGASPRNHGVRGCESNAVFRLFD